MAEYIEGAIEITAASICTSCLVCGEAVPVFYYRAAPKICDKCKAAILAMREQKENTDG